MIIRTLSSGNSWGFPGKLLRLAYQAPGRKLREKFDHRNGLKLSKPLHMGWRAASSHYIFNKSKRSRTGIRKRNSTLKCASHRNNQVSFLHEKPGRVYEKHFHDQHQLTLHTTLLQSHRQATQRLFSVKFLFGEASHCSPRIAIANCEQWYITFCIFSTFLNKLKLNIVTAQVRLLFVQKRKPKMFGLKTLMESGINGKILTFVIH